MLGLQRDFNPRMAEGPIRSVLVLPPLRAPLSQLIGPHRSPNIV